MKNENQERTPRGIDELIQDFQSLSGQFLKFQRGLNEREKVLFKGWLSQLRAKPAIING